jgi:hypothetical protein
MPSPYERIMQAGGGGNALREGYKASNPPSIDSSDGGGAWGTLTSLLGHLDRPAGALRAGITGRNPVEGFKNPSQYGLVDPNDPPLLRALGVIGEAYADPLNIIGAKYMSHMPKGTGFGTRFAAEGAVNLAARASSTGAASMIPDTAPDWLQALGPLAAGLAGAGTAVGATRGMATPQFKAGASRFAVDETGSINLGRAGDPFEEGFTKLGLTESAARGGTNALSGRSWVLPSGKEYSLGEWNKGAPTLFHDEVAKNAGTTRDDLLKAGAVRKASPGSYEVENLSNPTARKLLIDTINKDLDEIRAPSTKYLQNFHPDRITVDLSNDPNGRSIEFPIPAPGKKFSLPGVPAAPSRVQEFRNRTPGDEMRFYEQDMRAARARFNATQAQKAAGNYASNYEDEIKNWQQVIAADPTNAEAQMRLVEAQNAQYSAQHPTAALAAQSMSMGEIPPERALQAASADDISVAIRNAAINGGSTGVIPQMNQQYILDQADMLDEIYKAAAGAHAVASVDMAADLAKNLPETTKRSFGPNWLWRVVDGKTNRSPLAYGQAIAGHNYVQGQKLPIAIIRDEIDTFVEKEFGQLGEKISMKPDAPSQVRQAFTNAQTGEYGNAAIGIVAEHPQYFNLSDNQQMFMRALQRSLEYDVFLSEKFGVDVSFMYEPVGKALVAARKAGNAGEVARLEAVKTAGGTVSGVKRVSNYARHMTDLLGPDMKPLTAENYPRFLGSEKSFQQHRLLDSWVDVMDSASDYGNFQKRIQSAVRTAIAGGDLDEAERLQDLLRGGVRVGVRRGSFADSVTERLAQSARQRGEMLAMNNLKKYGGNIRDEDELKSLLNAAKIPDWLRIPAEAAGLIRGMQLRADFSILGVQAWGAQIMGKGLAGGLEGSINDWMKAVGTDEGWARYRMANAARMSDAVRHNLVLNENLLELPADLDLMKRKYSPHRDFFAGTLTRKGGETPGIAQFGRMINAYEGMTGYLDKVQFGRMASSWKLDTYDHTLGLMQAARDGHLSFRQMLTHPSLGLASLGKSWKELSDDDLKTAAASFSNNLFGGLNSAAQGRSTIHNLIESVFVLTPGFTRGTVSIGLQAANLAKWTPENVLARDFAIRGTALAAGMVKVFQSALNGTSDGTTHEANISDPSRSDWMTIVLPDGKTIRPLARWRGPAKIVGAAGNTLVTGITEGMRVGMTIDQLLKAGPLEASQQFSQDALRWATYRQSGLVTGVFGDPVGDVARGISPLNELGEPQWDNAGNQFAKDKGALNILTNPTGDVGQQMIDFGTGLLAPVALKAGGEVAADAFREGSGFTASALKDTMFALGLELLGSGETVPTRAERAVRQTGAEIVLDYGLPEDLVQLAVIEGKNPIMLKDANGQFLLTGDQRRDATQRVAAATGLSEDVVRQNGRLNASQRKEVLSGIQSAQLDNFFAGMDYANGEYATAMTQAQDAYDRGMPASQLSRFISEARKARAASKATTEKVNPAALGFLQSPDQMSKANSFDQLMKSISAEVYSKEFFDPDTLQFDFESRDQWYAEMRSKYGGAFAQWEQHQDRFKTPLEKDRDEAFDRLGTYFRVEDEIWQKFTGGQLGDTELDFDRQMTDQLTASGVTDPGMRNYLLSQIKQQIKPISLSHSTTTKVRQMMRMADPTLERDVTKWLGAQPIQTKRIAGAAGLINALKTIAD